MEARPLETVIVTDSISCPRCGYRGPVFQATVGYRWYHFLLAFTAIGRPFVMILVLLARIRERTCPACWNHEGLEPWDGAETSGVAELLARATATDRARVKRNHLVTAMILLTLMVVTFALVLAFGLP